MQKCGEKIAGPDISQLKLFHENDVPGNLIQDPSIKIYDMEIMFTRLQIIMNIVLYSRKID